MTGSRWIIDLPQEDYGGSSATAVNVEVQSIFGLLAKEMDSESERTN